MPQTQRLSKDSVADITLQSTVKSTWFIVVFWCNRYHWFLLAVESLQAAAQVEIPSKQDLLGAIGAATVLHASNRCTILANLSLEYNDDDLVHLRTHTQTSCLNLIEFKTT